MLNYSKSSPKQLVGVMILTTRQLLLKYVEITKRIECMYPPVTMIDMPKGEALSQPREGRAANVPPASTDCFSATVPRQVTLSSYVYAFYTNWFFNIELTILRFLAGMPSSNALAAELINGERKDFSGWEIEYRDDEQMVMADKMGTTKSWFMVRENDSVSTTLYFGSAVMPRVKRNGEISHPPLIFKLLGGFHNWYSKALLNAAVREILKK